MKSLEESMRPLDKEALKKKVVHEFKKFARKNNFWESYKKLSIPLNRANNRVSKHPIKFVELVELCEPVELIQSTKYFCCWPTSRAGGSGRYWYDLSTEWARICLSKCLWYNADTAMRYVCGNISSRIYYEYKEKGFLKE